MLPSLENLRCFAEAARLTNFRAAARAVGLTPAALGQRIRQLEGQLGRALFHRTTRRVVLTEAGLALLPHARHALLAGAECVRAALGELVPAPMEITLGTRHELGMSFLLPMLPRLRQLQPGLTIHLYYGSGIDLLIRVRTLEIQCAVGSMRMTDPTLDSIRLHREDYVFVARASLARRRPLRATADAASHTLIDLNSGFPLFGYWRDAPGGGDRLKFDKVLLMGTIAAIHALVLAGEGVAVLPAYLVAGDLKARRLTKLLPHIVPRSDYFRLLFRADDPLRSLYAKLAAAMVAVPLS